MTKILVIRFSSIGDIVLASPVFRCIKQQLAGAELHFVTKYAFRSVTEHNPYIDKFFYYDNNLPGLIDQLKRENYQYVIDLHKNIRSLKIRRKLKKKSFVIRKLSAEKFLLTEFNINRMPGLHITTRSLQTVEAIGVQDDGRGLDYFISEKDKVSTNDIPTSHQAGYICVVIGASYSTKKLPVVKLRELCSLIHHPIVLIGGKEDMDAAKEIEAADPVKIYAACGKFSINESADLIRRSKLVVSHDTGMQYIACALQKPVIAIWGATSPKLDVEPYYGSAYSKNELDKKYENVLLNLRCQPCSRYGESQCPLGHFNCMNNLDMQALANRVHHWLSKI